MNKYGIINMKNQYFRFSANNVKDAISLYIEATIGFEKGFSVSKAFLEEISKNITNTPNLVTLVNGLCTRKQYAINKIILINKYEYDSEAVG